MRLQAKEKTKLRGVTSNQLTRQVMTVLTVKGFHVWRQNNGGVYDAKFKGYRKNSSTPGISDVLGFHKITGRFIACEVKAGKDKLSFAQVLFLDNVNRAGGIGLEVRDIEQLMKMEL